jgi:predicted GIY-YIG superfamily endonuclease
MEKIAMRYNVSPSDIERIISKYYKEFRNNDEIVPIIKGPFEIDSLVEEQLYQKSGCYLIYDSGGNLRYIGMSETNMLNRVKNHCRESVKKCGFWINNPPHSVQIVETSASWEAPMIESYLTHHAKVDK